MLRSSINEDTYSCSIRPYCFTTPDEYFPDEETPETTAEEITETPSDSDEDEEETPEILVEGVTLAFIVEIITAIYRDSDES